MLGLLLLITACAGPDGFGWKGVIDPQLEIPPDPEATAAATGERFSIARVEDARVFRTVAHALREPSMLHREDDTPALRSRAVGRRKETRGGNLWLPEGRSVESVVADVATAALRRSGHRVVAADAEPAADASAAPHPVEIEILSLWTWLRVQRFGPDRYESEVAIRLRAPGSSLDDWSLTCGKHMVSSNGPSASVWRRALEGALLDLEADLQGLLESPGRPMPAWRCKPGV